MTNYDILIPTAVMALLRHEESVRGIADRFGVTECEVLTWRDLFVVAGVVALTGYRRATKSLWPERGPTGTSTYDPSERRFADEMYMWAPAPTGTGTPEHVHPTEEPVPDPDVRHDDNFNRTIPRPTSRRRQAQRAPRPARRHK